MRKSQEIISTKESDTKNLIILSKGKLFGNKLSSWEQTVAGYGVRGKNPVCWNKLRLTLEVCGKELSSFKLTGVSLRVCGNELSSLEKTGGWYGEFVRMKPVHWNVLGARLRSSCERAQFITTNYCEFLTLFTSKAHEKFCGHKAEHENFQNAELKIPLGPLHLIFTIFYSPKHLLAFKNWDVGSKITFFAPSSSLSN
ncbi:hypothetical protein HAX54_026811 [Datura stramonium]|uniref:Uncharacterized protein n=1 Tax=Datura stramonium TaxID=4076 RepID=A0ABS8S879_DATST|nr:hypothetical protein [Datura stramonium]